MNTNFDFNDSGAQRDFELIPAGTIVTLQMMIKKGGAGDDGWLTTAADHASEGLDVEFIVTEGKYAGKMIFQRLTLRGNTDGHAKAGEISRNFLRAVLESARGVRFDDTSVEAQAKRKTSGWDDFDNLRFIARVGVKPARDNFDAKNVIKEVITPERHAWSRIEQVKSAATTTTSPPMEKPEWAKG